MIRQPVGCYFDFDGGKLRNEISDRREIPERKFTIATGFFRL